MQLLARPESANKTNDPVSPQANKAPYGPNYSKILDRTSKAVEWFGPRMDEQLIANLEQHIEQWSAKKRTKRYVTDLKSTLTEFKRKKEQLAQCLDIAENLSKTVSLQA